MRQTAVQSKSEEEEGGKLEVTSANNVSNVDVKCNNTLSTEDRDG